MRIMGVTFLGSEGGVHGLDRLADIGAEDPFLLENGFKMVLFLIAVGHGHGWRLAGNWVGVGNWSDRVGWLRIKTSFVVATACCCFSR